MKSQMISQRTSQTASPSLSQTILWTALPAGYIQVQGQSQKWMRILVYVSPRLNGPASATLQAFKDFNDWPAHADPNALKFSVQFGNPPNQPPIPATRTSAPPESLLWGAILPPNTPVINYQPEDHTGYELHSFPAQRIHNFIRQGLGGLAADSTTATQHPTRQRALDRFGAIAMAPPIGAPHGPIHAAAQTRFATAQRTLQQAMSQNKVVPLTVAEPALDFHRLLVFHAPGNLGVAPRAGIKAAAPTRVDVHKTLADFQKNLDFHKVLSFLTNYPGLLLRLGLVIELAIPPPQNLPPSGTTVHVVPQWSPATPTRSSSPLTMCQATSAPPTFLPSPSPTPSLHSQNGMLALASPGDQFGLVQIDLDGAGIKIANWLQEAALASEGQDGIPGTEAATAPPTLRSAGFSLAQTGHDVWLQNKFVRHKNDERALAQTGKLSNVLYAEDVNRGYRVDVQDVTTGGPWHSLCQRNGNYTFDAANPQLRNWQFQDEGFVQLGVTKPTDGSQQYQVSEWLFRWNGWSLAVPRPGNTIGRDDQGRDDKVIAPNYSSQTQYGVGTQFLPVPGSLPRLRFGHAYRLRARAVDLAGNSLSLTEADDSQATPPTTYFRYEPIDAPLLALTGPLQNSPGESIARVVIRSNYQQSAHNYSAAHPPFAEIAERHIAPPITTPEMAETHGMFDGMSPDDSYALISQHQGTLQKDSASGNSIYTGNQMKIPYLPDPLARGPAFFLLPAPPAPEMQFVPLNTKTIGPPDVTTPDGKPIGPIDFYSGRNTPDVWPVAASLKLRIIDGTASPGKPSWDLNARVLTIPLPQGAMWTLRLSSYPTQADLETLMGIWDWVKNTPDASGKTHPNPNAATLEPAALMGLQWMLTPYREITLVHAVQQPLVIPKFQGLSANRSHGDTFASLGGNCPVDGTSTAKLDILAEWQDPFDDLSNKTDRMPKLIHGKAHAAEIKVDPRETATPPPHGPPVPRPPLPPCGLEGGALLAWIRSQHDPRDPQGHMTWPKWATWNKDWRTQQGGQAVGVSFRHELHDTKRRKVSYTPIATTRFREYFPENTSPLTQTGPPQAVDLPSTARPAAPKVLYVIPIFKFQTGTSGNAQTSARLTGLRVYMERPWYSSGEGELLGVVLWPSPPPSSPLGGDPPCKQLTGDCVPGPSGGGAAGAAGGAGGAATGGATSGGHVHAAERPMSRQVQRTATEMINPRLGLISAIANVPRPHLELPNPLLPYVTQWGMDPLWLSGPVSDLPSMADFKNAVAMGTFLTLDELVPDPFQYTGEFMQPTACTPYRDDLRVSVVGFQPGYDNDRQLWYCDIEIDPQGSYFPFIRLALARFQPHSVSYQESSRADITGTWYYASSVLDVHLSRVVLADFAQIAPNRNLSVVHNSASQLTLTLTGVSYSASSAGRGTSEVEISLETQQAGVSDDLGWTPVPNSVHLLRAQASPPNTIWQGQINLPATIGSQPHRLVIREFERFMSDETGTGATAGGPPQILRRLVYADAVKL